ncbi:MAG TPA: PorP/SprF family type IX secretion system membrane protein [Saprospiraceae bacterium]|nr:PorP/SprF family type IX secretion system membrane protein [Saprospiraceae bacterium]
MRYKILLLPLLIFCFDLANGQDIHFTQFYNTPLTVSPALTGIFNGDQRYIGVYRGQWYSANSPFSTFYGMFDQKIYNRKLGNSFLAAGGALGYDRAGDSKLSLFNLSLNGSYTYAIDRENFLTGGLMLGVAQRSFKYDNLLWDNQWDGDRADPNLSPNEGFDDSGYIFADIGIGVNYRGQKLASRSTLDIGASLSHLNKPNQSFADSEVSRLEPRLSTYIIQNLQISNRFDVYWNGLAQFQNNYLEGVGGLGGRLHLDQRRGRELAVQLGMAFRFNAIGDAAIAAAELHYQYWRFGLSYDINVSGLKIATNRNGGPEVTVRYIVHFVKPIPVFRICPII